MTSRTSLFNYGIFKSTIKRFRWGSFLYFAALFFSVPFLFLVQNVYLLENRMRYNTYAASIFLESEYMIMPLLLTMVVPSITAVLLFRYMHTGRQSVFVHGLPITRKNNFISGILAGFVLMGLPVIANGLILLVMSFFSYSKVMASWDVLLWTGVQLAILTVMFAVAVFTAFLTGHAAAHIGVNILVHVLPLLVSLTIYMICQIYLFGFMQAENFFAEKLMEYTPFVWMFGKAVNLKLKDFFLHPAIWCYLAGAVVTYVCSYLLYKYRKVETAGDVAGFRSIRSILKYAVTTVAAVASLGILYEMELGATAVFIASAVICAIVYFGCEMLMRKTLKVFRCYKGYFGFAVCCGAILAFCAFTSIFGYETRVPELDQIADATVYSYDVEEIPYVENTDAIATVRTIHQEQLQTIPLSDREYLYDREINRRSMTVSYRLKNGKILQRQYSVPMETYDVAMERMYAYPEYKNRVHGFDNLNVENVKAAELEFCVRNYNQRVTVSENASELLAAAKKDVEALSYSQLRQGNILSMEISVSCSEKDNEVYQIFKEFEHSGNPRYYGASTYVQYDGGAQQIRRFSVRITPEWSNTITLLKEWGTYDFLLNQTAENVYLCKTSIFYTPGDEKLDNAMYTYQGNTLKEYQLAISKDDCVRLTMEDGRRLLEELIAKGDYSGHPVGEGHYLFIGNDRNSFSVSEDVTVYPKDTLPDYLLLYLSM